MKKMMSIDLVQQRLFFVGCLVLVFGIVSIVDAIPTIQLGDNTPKNFFVATNVLGDDLSASGPLSYTLLQTKVNAYFMVDQNTQNLMTRRVVDRDLLCAESGLCCPQSSQTGFQDSGLSNLRSGGVAGSDLESVCTLRLDVACTAGQGLVPTTFHVYIEVRDENDHAPVFAVQNSGPLSHDLSSLYSEPGFITNPPVLVLNVSEATLVGTQRIHLPLATDIDAPPFNVQQYLLVGTGDPSSHSFPERYFKLDVQRRETLPGRIDDGAPITGLDLVLLSPLDRESQSSFEFRVLAVDGGSPNPYTGTLSIKIIVTDANDHRPVFDRSAFEVSVDEGVASDNKPILRVVAHDKDEGPNGRIHYSWNPEYELFGTDTQYLDRVLSEADIDVPPERLAQLQALPTYWFRLDGRSGDIFVHRPLDFETRRVFVFKVRATNPDAEDAVASEKGNPATQTSTATVTINVNNLNDEAPQISIDYVNNNESVRHKQVLENSPANHFIALIKATDADAGNSKSPASVDSPYMTPYSAQFPGMHSKSQQTSDGGVVTCELANHADNYTLVRSDAGTEYYLQTSTSLDREREQRQFVAIRCYDHGTPRRTSTATVEVEIQDQNDCVPQIRVNAPPSTSHVLHQPAVLVPLPRSRLSDILNAWSHDWPSQSQYAEHALVNAYDAGVPVVSISVRENRPPGTVVASLRGVDADSGNNGAVVFSIVKEDLRLPRTIPAPLPRDHQTGQYPEAPLDQNLPPVPIRSDAKAVELFKLEAGGAITTNRMIDREASLPIRDEIYLFVEAHDRGSPTRLTTYVLLAIKIEDENDNPPVFTLPQFTFTIFENEEAPQRLGEIVVFDNDVGPPREADLTSSEDYQNPRVSESLQAHLNLLINPSHGLSNLPFVIETTPDGRFWLNVTRSLDREVEDTFRFTIQATDYGGSSVMRHTVTATVTVSVIDVNDNAPEIIFPRPATAETHVHHLSYLEIPEYEILSVNAKDKDPGSYNGGFRFELASIVSSLSGVDQPKLAKTALDGDLFKLDAVKGLLRTRRKMTEADLGEHLFQLVVRDNGSPPLESRQVIRIGVNQSPPHYAHSNSNAHPPTPQIHYSFRDSAMTPRMWGGGQSAIPLSHILLISGVAILFIGVLSGLIFCVCVRRQRVKCFDCLSWTFQTRRTPGNALDPADARKHLAPTGLKAKLGVPLATAPQPPTSLDDCVVSPTRLRCINSPFTNGRSKRAFGSSVNGTARGGECPEFWERQQRFYNDCYHVGIPVSQVPLTTRFVPASAATFKPIGSPREEYPPTTTYYNSCNLPDRQNYHALASTMSQAAVAVPVCYAGGTSQQASQSIPPHNISTNRFYAQGSCELLASGVGSRGNRGLSTAGGGQFKSEPSLAPWENFLDEEEVDLVYVGNDASSSDEYLNNAAANSNWQAPVSTVVGQADRKLPTDNQSITTTATNATAAAAVPENYAVTFPHFQASFV